MYARIKNAGDANTGAQNANNGLVLQENNSGCCGDALANCQYTIAFTNTGKTLTTLTLSIDGTSTALSLGGVSATDAVAIRRAIDEAVRGAYYIESEPQTDFLGVDVDVTGSTTTVVLTGDLVVTNIITSSGTEAVDSTHCTQATLCTETFEGFTGGVSTIRINGTNVSLGTVTPGSTSAGTLDTNITAAFVTAGVTVAGVAVTANGSVDYDIVITGVPSGTSIRLNGVSTVTSDCVATFITPA